LTTVRIDTEQLTHAGRDPHRSAGGLRRDHDLELGDPTSSAGIRRRSWP
jgi:hypothetical protein